MPSSRERRGGRGEHTPPWQRARRRSPSSPRQGGVRPRGRSTSPISSTERSRPSIPPIHHMARNFRDRRRQSPSPPRLRRRAPSRERRSLSRSPPRERRRRRTPSPYGERRRRVTPEPRREPRHRIRSRSRERRHRPEPPGPGQLYVPLLDVFSSDVENIERYRPGGFHPIHIGECIDAKDRYEVVQKLGYGIHSTVWLCMDWQCRKWRVVKVLEADYSAAECSELKVFKVLEGISQAELAENHVGLALDYFWIVGPNGNHLCFVSKLLASTSCVPPPGYGPQAPGKLRDICYQLSKGIKYLHDRGICHGGKFSTTGLSSHNV
jgi:hypothetical protein